MIEQGGWACCARRLLGLTNPDAYKSGGDALEVRIKADKDAHTVTIE